MRIAAVGDNCMDVYSQPDTAYPGGNPVNVAVYFRRLGEQASYTGVVGDDTYGEVMKRTLMDKGVDVSHLHIVPGKTAVTMVDLVDGERVFGDYIEGVMEDFSLNDNDIDFLKTHDLIHSGIWGRVERDLVKLRRPGLPVSFDFADKLEHEIVTDALPYVDYAFFSYPQDDETIRAYIQRAQAAGPKLVIATLGENGSLAFDGHTYTQHGIVPVQVVDSMGAGDSYIAGFMRGVLLGKTLEECMHLGAENASQTLKYMGAWQVEE